MAKILQGLILCRTLHEVSNIVQSYQCNDWSYTEISHNFATKETDSTTNTSGLQP